MNDTDAAIALAIAFGAGCAAVLGLQQRREATIRALALITLIFGMFLGAVAASGLHRDADAVSSVSETVREVR